MDCKSLFSRSNSKGPGCGETLILKPGQLGNPWARQQIGQEDLWIARLERSGNIFYVACWPNKNLNMQIEKAGLKLHSRSPLHEAIP